MSDTHAARPRSHVSVHVDSEGIRVVNGAGAQIRLAVAPSPDGFNPLELQSAALGLCTAMTLRTELRRVLAESQAPRFELDVEGSKAANDASRLAQLNVVVHLHHALDEATRTEVLHRAEATCTIANTLRSGAEVDSRFGDDLVGQ